MPVVLQNVTIPGKPPTGPWLQQSPPISHARASTPFIDSLNPVLALAWRELLPPALGADRSLNPVSIESRSTISSDPTARASRRFDSRAEIRDDNCDSIAKGKQSQEKRVARTASVRI